MRHYEYHYNSKGLWHKLLKLIYRFRVQHYAHLLGFECNAPNIFGKGLKISHSGAVIVNSKSRVGENCTIIGPCCLGGKNGSGGPIIGNSCELGIFCIVIGEVTIADNVKIGAGAVVTKDCEIVGASLVGVPAKPLISKNVKL